jgi:adhesin/invasin
MTIAIDSATDNDTLAIGTTLAVRVHVTQNSVPVLETAVAWTVTTGNGTVSAPTTFTDSTGTATVNWTMGDTVTVNTITASISGATVTIVANTVGGTVAGITKVSADSQMVVAGGSVPLTARAVDRFGNAVANATVLWSSTGGSLSATTTTSGANGNTVSNLSTDSSPATYLVTASVPGQASVTFKVVGQ